MLTLAAGLSVAFVTGCTTQPPPPPVVTSHDPAWVDAAVGLVGTASDHDPVIKVTITPRGATVITRRADSRQQRSWFVGVSATSPQPGPTISPTPTPTPTPSASAPGAPIRPSSSPRPDAASLPVTDQPGLPQLPQPSAPATPLGKVQVDNTYGNMSLGTFGDTQILPMWQKLQALGCTGDSWSIVGTAGWSGTIITHGTCGALTAVEVNGRPLPNGSDEATLLQKQLSVLTSLMPNDVSILSIQRTLVPGCPTTLTADYGVRLGGPLQLRTTLTCGDVTTVTLDDGYLPKQALAVNNVSASVIGDVTTRLSELPAPVSASTLTVQWSSLYGEEAIVPEDGAPSFSLGGTELRPGT